MADSQSKKYDCVIWGGYGHGNTGDEWCLAAACRKMQNEFGADVAILSANPEYTSWLFPEATVVPYFRPPWIIPKREKKILKRLGSLLAEPEYVDLTPHWQFDAHAQWVNCVANARQLYLAGGGYLNDLFPLDQILPPIELALKHNVSIVTAPVGLGPFKTAEMADRFGLIQRMNLKVRDQVSHELCRARDWTSTLSPDDAFAEIKNNWPDKIKNSTGSRPRKIGVCIFPQYGQDENLDLSDWWTQCLRALKLQLADFEIEGFCFHTALREEFREMVRLFLRAGLPARQVQPPILDFREATGAIRKYDFIISTRFHAVIAANVFGIPNLAVAAGDYYAAKMNAAVLGYEQLSQFVNPIVTPPEKLVVFCKNALTNAHEF